MPKSFDITTKMLVEERPKDWLAYAGIPAEDVVVIDADLSTFMAEADKVLFVRAPYPHIVHFEFQSTYDASMGERLLRYSVLLSLRHGLPVRSLLVLLRPSADGPALTENVTFHFPQGERYLEFTYRILRPWQEPVATFLQGGLGTLPIAPLAHVAREDLPDVVRRMEERIAREATPTQAADLWTATLLLMGLQFPADFTAQLLKGVRQMKESTTYQMILQEGRQEGQQEGRVTEARTILLRLGTKRFGTPDADTQSAIEAITGYEELERLTERVLEAESWNELLAA